MKSFTKADQKAVKVLYEGLGGSRLVAAMTDPPLLVTEPDDYLFGVYIDDFEGWALTLYLPHGEELPKLVAEAKKSNRTYPERVEAMKRWSPTERLLRTIFGETPIEFNDRGSWEMTEAGRVAVFPLDTIDMPGSFIKVRAIYFSEAAYT